MFSLGVLLTYSGVLQIIQQADHHDLLASGNETYHQILAHLKSIQDEYRQLSKSLDRCREERTRLNTQNLVLWYILN